jgi:hypothetical protein
MDAVITNRGFFAISGAILVFAAGETLFFNAIRDLRDESRNLKQSIVGEITEVREKTLVTNHEQAVQLDVLRGELTAVREQTTTAAGEARADAQRHAVRLTNRLALQAYASTERVAQELMNVRAAAAATHAAAGNLNGQVWNTRAEVAAARSGVKQTFAELNAAAGELGPMRDAIATNSRELAMMRARGERNFFEFNLDKSMQREVAGIKIRLRKADARRNRYTVELTAAGRAIEEKDRNVNEPVRFYVAQGRLPYELVVNRIANDRIEGYLAAPAY